MAHHTYSVGLCGTGTIAAVHAVALTHIPNAELVATAEPKVKDGDDFAAEFGATHYLTLEEMLAHPGLEVVIVSSPSGLHAEQVEMAARAGKYVISEKPMGITPESLSRMIATCEEAGQPLTVIFQNRLQPDQFRTRHAIAKGLIGVPIMANGTVYWRRDDAYYAENGGWRGTWALDGGGALMNQAIHTVDLLQWLMGGITSVQAQVATLNHDIETEDAAVAAFTFGNGAIGSITATTCAPKDELVRIEIVGSTGRITLENNVAVVWTLATPKEEIALTPEEEVLVAEWKPGEEFGDAHRRQLQAIFNALAAGQEPYVPGRQAREAVDRILDIYESARTGQRITHQASEE